MKGKQKVKLHTGEGLKVADLYFLIKASETIPTSGKALWVVGMQFLKWPIVYTY